MEKPSATNSFYAADRKKWRQWLQQNHQSRVSVWLLIYHKSGSKPSVYYDEAVEEALCFGWIDSKPAKNDAESYYLFFSRRNPKSNWSKANRERVERLSAGGLIMPAGQAVIDIAKKTGTWDALVDVENGVIPPDMQQLFDKNKTAYDNFMAFSASSKRIILEWILNAKRPETRQKRIEEAVALAEKNLKANHK
ncbi:hypothetical protein CHU92_08460 [Flavobacterium cyanobacteriorum]|uniref:Bacteriocin-protection protein n=1 Tax=Flavobacterium cyanobacteriorum TaxID=2022802 RepID=A0A255Z762_9FLAO|nr:YdeI/OmpD-associated family protein [Flavobacterium cyanobacteriorum]OYQ37318.1 hypothetical protein CHU92_08460 [Flavobacterium cyanobacteriorum]